MIKFILNLFISTSILLGSGTLFASGGDFFGADRGVSENTYFQDKYDLGKRVLETKVLCNGCPLAGTALNGEGVQLIAAQLKKDGALAQVLSKSERKAAKYYIKKRFY